ncbi:pyridoxal-phosphate-dependent aminotransferase family protein [Candidatus Entotheonella palauensis]|uniref:pyridoxal-phosphate-dependent aminotransferase family protein n=1 Tax=Candidatus Entotheonella palauensis TaxID=93172 RepID=UPI0015C4D42A|nr:alanine--glyoxylate aminotransferase family protein [Candidatus Entotheonella palauensis]
MQTEDILMCPGPNEIADRVIRAMMRPATCPIVGEFPEFYEQTMDLLAEVFQTRNEVIPLPGSGRSGLEGALTSVLEPGDRSLTIVNGMFGETAIRIANAVGGKAEGLAMPWGEPIDLQAFKQKLSSGSYKLVTMVHNETSTGALYDAAEVSQLAHEHGALFLLDAISSLAGADLPTDAWDVDLVVGCNHKAIGAPIGHAYVSVSERAWEVMAKRQQPCGSVFSNLLYWKPQPNEEPDAVRSMTRSQGVFTAVHLIYALNEALKMILEEGLEARFARHRLNAAAFRAGIHALGLETLAHPDVVSPTVTCVKLPEGITSVEFLKHFSEDHGLLTLRGLGDFNMNAVRIGHMGVTATPRNILHALHAFDLILKRLGHAHTCGAGVARASEIYAETDEHRA